MSFSLYNTFAPPESLKNLYPGLYLLTVKLSNKFIEIRV